MLVQQKTSDCSNQDVQKNRDTGKEDKWVINLSSTPLTEEHEKLLAHGPKFVIKPRQALVNEYIVATEQACTKLEQGKQEEFRVEVKKLLQQDQNKRRSTNVSKEEFKALRELKKDNNMLILTADKGVALVVINKTDYIKNAEDLLKEDMYKRIPEDPTVKQRNKLINILKSIKAEGGLNEESYRRLYPTGAGSPKFYGLPKIHKPGIPLRPIISGIGTVTYNTAKELAKILKPLVGLSKHHIHNTRDFVEQLKEVRLKKEESMVSYDVTALFTSVPIPPALKIIEEKLIQDKDLQQRTRMSIKHIIKLLDFCLRSTYFVFQGQYYEQVEGAAMGSPLSPIVANIYMKHFETKSP